MYFTVIVSELFSSHSVSEWFIIFIVRRVTRVHREKQLDECPGDHTAQEGPLLSWDMAFLCVQVRRAGNSRQPQASR